jgi:hypothetical protein
MLWAMLNHAVVVVAQIVTVVKSKIFERYNLTFRDFITSH